MKHHTKNKGDLGVLKAQASLCEQGYLVLIPMSEHSPFDLVAYKEGSFYRIQVKYRKISKRKTLEVIFKSYWSNKNGIQSKKQDLSKIDVCCVYCPDTDKCYYINLRNIKTYSISLKMKKGKNDSRSRLAENHLDMSQTLLLSH